MRLLEANAFPPRRPEDKLTYRPYAILSHVWEDDELTYADLHEHERADLDLASPKVRGAQRQAAKDNLKYLWTDTCCIDKSSSAELGEAINSMYRWYQEAQVCYVYLADLDGCPPLTDADLRHGGETASQRYWNARFRQSRWFSRGWTLQELIAPSKLRFYDCNWNLIGDLRDLASTVSDITGVHLSMLQHALGPNDFSLAQRMCWAAGRETTRPEDRAYSLLGLLDMSIDIRYGEGTRAFIRLQEAIIERSSDQSIFAWEKTLVKDEDVYMKQPRRDSYIWTEAGWTALLASSPDAFVGARNIVPTSQPSLPYRMTNIGLHVTAQVHKSGMKWMLLNCYDREDPTKAILLNLRCELTETQQQKNVTVGHVWLRQRSPQQPLSLISRLSLMNADEALRLTTQTEIYIANSQDLSGRDGSPKDQYNVWLQLPQHGRYYCQNFLYFNTSEPKSNENTDNLTWTLESHHHSPTPQPATLTLSMVYSTKRNSDTDDTPITIRIEFFEIHAIVYVQAREKARQIKATVRILFTANTDWVQLAYLKRLGIEVTAAIKREYLNGQQWHIVKISAEHGAVQSRSLRSLWHALKIANCGSASTND